MNKECFNNIHFILDGCRKCGKPIVNYSLEEQSIKGCGYCLNKSFYFDKAISCIEYNYIYFGAEDPKKNWDERVEKLKSAGINMTDEEENTKNDLRFEGKTFVLTGTLSEFTRKEASDIIESFGGKTSSSVSKQTDYVLAGEEAGSKLDKAKKLGIKVITEEEFRGMII